MTGTGLERSLARFVSAVDDEGGVYGVHLRRGHDTAVHRWRSDDRVNIYPVSTGVCWSSAPASPS